MENNEINYKLVNLQIKAYRDGLSLMDSVEKVIRKFDGKQITKRFDTALKEIDERLSYTMQFNSFDITMYIEDRSISESKQDISGYKYGVAHYLKDSKVIICGGCIEYGGSPEKSFIIDGKFNAKAAIERLENQKEYLTSYTKEAEEQLESVVTLQKEKENIENSVRKFNDKVNYMIAQYFDLRLNLQR